MLIQWKVHTDAPRDLQVTTLFLFPFSFILNNVMSAENKPILQALLENFAILNETTQPFSLYPYRLLSECLGESFHVLLQATWW